MRARQERNSIFLIVCLLRGEILRRSEMSECPFQLDVLALGQRSRKGLDLLRRNAQPVHACIDLQMKRHASFPAKRLGATLQVLKIVSREIPPASDDS